MKTVASGNGAPATSEREHVLTPADFRRTRALIYRLAGISLGDSKENMVYSRLVRRLRALGMARFSEYLDRVEQGDPAEQEAFINALTTNLTAFFREPHHFPILADHLRSLGGGERIRLWCSASSTGEEAYSMAMTAIDALGDGASRVEIVASDIDTAVLARAKEGVYPLDAVASLEAGLLERHFLRGTGSRAGQVRVKPAVRSRVQFRQVNLLDQRWAVEGPFDAIFCRNVMIYFDKETQARLLARFARLVRPGGRLFAGHSENLAFARRWFEPLGGTVYAAAATTSETVEA